jgi:hypothetical protein
MTHKLSGRDGKAITIPDGGHGLQGRDGGNGGNMDTQDCWLNIKHSLCFICPS